MDLAIIGAGVAGLAAARALRQRRPDLAITIYEQGDGLGGRVATCRREGYVFDHGAQNARAPTPELARLLTAELPGDGLRDIGLPVWVFDSAGAIAEGDPALNAEPKWTYGDGLIRLAERLGDGLDVRLGTRIGSLRRTTDDRRPTTDDRPSGRFSITRSPAHPLTRSPHHGHWLLVDAGGQQVGEADMVLLTPPAPQAAAIVAASAIEPQARAALLAELARATYRRCISVALAYDRRIERPFYALLNVDRAHPIAWLAIEHAKGPERCPPGHSLLIAQMGARWSLEHWETPAEQLGHPVADLVGALLGEDLRAPLWHDVARWPYALPDTGAGFVALNGADTSLFFAGDYTAGLGRIHLAIESGWRATDVILRALDERK